MDLFKGGAGKAMTVSLILMMYQQFSGVNAVIFYSGKVRLALAAHACMHACKIGCACAHAAEYAPAALILWCASRSLMMQA